MYLFHLFKVWNVINIFNIQSTQKPADSSLIGDINLLVLLWGLDILQRNSLDLLFIRSATASTGRTHFADLVSGFKHHFAKPRVDVRVFEKEIVEHARYSHFDRVNSEKGGKETDDD